MSTKLDVRFFNTIVAYFERFPSRSTLRWKDLEQSNNLGPLGEQKKRWLKYDLKTLAKQTGRSKAFAVALKRAGMLRGPSTTGIKTSTKLIVGAAAVAAAGGLATAAVLSTTNKGPTKVSGGPTKAVDVPVAENDAPSNVAGGWTQLVERARPWKLRHNEDTTAELNHLYVRECGGGGDCFFHSVAHGLQLLGIEPRNVGDLGDRKGSKGPWTFRDVRALVANGLDTRNDISLELASQIQLLNVSLFQRMKQTLDPALFNWNVALLNNFGLPGQETQDNNAMWYRREHKNVAPFVDAMKAQMQTAGNVYQGSTTSLRLLENNPAFAALDVGFIILELSNTQATISCHIFNQNASRYMLLYNPHVRQQGQDVGHWQLGGYRDIVSGNVSPFVMQGEFPTPIARLFIEDCQQ